MRQKEHPLYWTWMGMKDRCHCKTNSYYKSYGGRGIKVCERWLGVDGFWNFVADMGEKPKGFTLERDNNNGNYEPSNCKWASRYDQFHNCSRAIHDDLEHRRGLTTSQKYCIRKKRKAGFPNYEIKQRKKVA